MICNMGFYQKIRNDITDRWMGLKDLQNRQKIKYNVSFISLSLFTRIQMVRNWIVRNTSILIVLFKSITRIIWRVAVNVIFFTVSSSDDLEISQVAVNGFKQSCPPWQLQNGVLLVASTYLRRRPLALHWIKSSNSGGAGLPSAMTGI